MKTEKMETEKGRKMKTKEFDEIESVSIISNGLEIKGNIDAKGNIRIEGRIEGNINVLGNIVIGNSGVVKGELKCNNLTVGGNIEGNVIISDKLILENKSVLKGDITTKILVIEEGAIFEGNSKMTKEKENIFVNEKIQ